MWNCCVMINCVEKNIIYYEFICKKTMGVCFFVSFSSFFAYNYFELLYTKTTDIFVIYVILCL